MPTAAPSVPPPVPADRRRDRRATTVLAPLHGGARRRSRRSRCRRTTASVSPSSAAEAWARATPRRRGGAGRRARRGWPTSTTAASRSAAEKFGKDVQTTRDYREVLARKDVDCGAHCDPRPLARPDVHRRDGGRQGRLLREADDARDRRGRADARRAEADGRILQVGSQWRCSSIVYGEGARVFQSGALGQVNLMSWTNRNRWVPCTGQKDASPQRIDWDRFLGSAPKRPFEPARVPVAALRLRHRR